MGDVSSRHRAVHQDGLPQQLGRAVAGAVAGAAQSVGRWFLGDIHDMVF